MTPFIWESMFDVSPTRFCVAPSQATFAGAIMGVIVVVAIVVTINNLLVVDETLLAECPEMLTCTRYQEKQCGISQLKIQQPDRRGQFDHAGPKFLHGFHTIENSVDIRAHQCHRSGLLDG